MTRTLTGSLRAKLIAWFFVPTAIILVAVALVNFNSYQNVTEDLVIERDRDLTQLWAGQLATNLDRFPKVLNDVSHTLGVSKRSGADVQVSLTGASPELRIFDGGVVVLDTFGTVTAAHPLRSDLMGQDWSNRDHFRQMLRVPGPIFSDVLYEGSQETEVIEVAVPITGDQSEFLGSMVGVFRLRATSNSAFYSGILRLRIGNGGSYIVDGNGTVLYHDDREQVGADFGTYQPVTQVRLGEVGAFRNQDQEGTDQVSAFAPILGTPWGLVTEESWASLTSGSRNTQRYLLLLLALGVAVPAIVFAIGLKRLMRPIEELKKAAKEVARGNFGQTVAVHSGDEIEELATEFNLMSEQLKDSYEQLEQRVVERTEELTASELRYRALFEESRDAIFLTSPKGTVVAANRATLELFEFPLEEAIGSDIGDRFVDPVDRDRFRQVIGQTGSVKDFELKLCKRDGTQIDCLLTATRRLDEAGQYAGLHGAIRDITQRKLANQALLETEAKYRHIFDDSKDPIFITSREGRILDANQAGLDVFGYEIQELLGLSVQEMCEDPECHAMLVAKVNSEGSVKDYEIRLLRKNGSVADCVVSLIAQRDAQDRIVAYQGMVRDITETKLAEVEALQQTREVAVLEERNRMAREIHDTMAQGFTGIVLQMEAAEQSIETSPGALPDHLNRARALAREGLQEARRSVWGLMPQALERSTLDTALREEIRRFDAEGRAKISFIDSGDRWELPPDVQTVLLRICQESLTNIRRHADASEVTVNLNYGTREVLLSVQDNGVGFDPSAVQVDKKETSFGLIGMRQRAEQIKGQLIVDSAKNQGTAVRLTIPIS